MYKNLLSLKDLGDTELNQIIDTAIEMKRIILSRVKRGPQLLGKVLAIVGEYSQMETTALELSIQYLSGIAVKNHIVATKDDLLTLKAVGADFIICSSAEELLNQATLSIGGGLIKFGGSGESPLATLATLLTIKQRVETLKSVEVAVLGNISAHLPQVESLSEALRRYESRVSVFVSDKNIATSLKEKNIRVDADVNMTVSGADVIIDFGCDNKDNFAYYGDYMGLTTDHIKLAQLRVPLFFNTHIFDKENMRIIDYPQSAYYDYYANLTAVTMAVMYIINRN